jgi:hypothetical protein
VHVSVTNRRRTRRLVIEWPSVESPEGAQPIARADGATRPDSRDRMSMGFASPGAQILVAPQASERMGNPD